MEPSQLSAVDTVRALAAGDLRAIDLTEACLARIAEVEDDVQAWTYLDPEHARAQARELDERREQGAAIGPLHGLPVGVKDIVDTADMPTENGSVLHAGRSPMQDATVVSLMHAAGAVILGKTVTTEFATYSPGKTKNPHDPARTPGGSSSGSAAGVAAGMMPLAIGSQTNGSVIRPATYCGVYGFKPTHGLISRRGVLLLSHILDHVGVFARSVADAALLAENLMAFDDRDPDMRAVARPKLLETALSEPPLPPRFAFVKTPVWDKADAATEAAFAELAAMLGDRVEEVALPEPFERAVDWHRTVMEVDLAVNLAAEYDIGADRLSSQLRGMIEAGQKALAVDYAHAATARELLNARFGELAADYDAVITPAATGEAPVGLGATGNPIFCTLWTLMGVPAITLPVFAGENGLPMGLQLVGWRGDDARLLRTAHWLVDRLEG